MLLVEPKVVTFSAKTNEKCICCIKTQFLTQLTSVMLTWVITHIGTMLAMRQAVFLCFYKFPWIRNKQISTKKEMETFKVNHTSPEVVNIPRPIFLLQVLWSDFYGRFRSLIFKLYSLGTFEIANLQRNQLKSGIFEFCNS